MLVKTSFTVPSNLVEQAADHVVSTLSNTVLNMPTGNFFYDPWQIKSEYKGTVWDTILQTLSVPYGEARVINLPTATNYHIHADIDDRYHLNITGDMSYLIDFDNQQFHLLEPNGIWYDMDAGRMHSAANFGKRYRVQLVVRKLLTNASMPNGTRIKVYSDTLAIDDARFVFDSVMSPWLNKINKQGLLSNFKTYPNASIVEFTTSLESVKDLESILTDDIKLEFV